MMDATELARMKAIAEAATPGPWKRFGMAGVAAPEWEIVDERRIECDCGEPVALTGCVTNEDAIFIATFDPPTVLALIAEVELLKRDRDLCEKHSLRDAADSGAIASQRDRALADVDRLNAHIAYRAANTIPTTNYEEMCQIANSWRVKCETLGATIDPRIRVIGIDDDRTCVVCEEAGWIGGWWFGKDLAFDVDRRGFVRVSPDAVYVGRTYWCQKRKCLDDAKLSGYVIDEEPLEKSEPA